ncbi:thioredoxin [Mycoplasmopsis mucosicanis]|uniref:Thioredoxin n=1 Tax=Mycoplasmopsis mucosicanis TaxID=458208 RepID=A0A507SY65_9BACT|nr:thioredoxin family protein [Mycoplasmopsis mucosicanis]TQC54192.1 thioredoxin [Mycoplasmopsis mucosicanis]
MKQLNWDEAQHIISDKKNKNKVFFVVFTMHNQFESAVMEYIYDEIFQDFKNEGNVKCIQIDIDEAKIYQDLNDKYHILSVPIFLIIQNNQIKKRGIGFYPKEIIVDFIEEHL